MFRTFSAAARHLIRRAPGPVADTHPSRPVWVQQPDGRNDTRLSLDDEMRVIDEITRRVLVEKPRREAAQA